MDVIQSHNDDELRVKSLQAVEEQLRHAETQLTPVLEVLKRTLSEVRASREMYRAPIALIDASPVISVALQQLVAACNEIGSLVCDLNREVNSSGSSDVSPSATDDEDEDKKKTKWTKTESKTDKMIFDSRQNVVDSTENVIDLCLSDERKVEVKTENVDGVGADASNDVHMEKVSGSPEFGDNGDVGTENSEPTRHEVDAPRQESTPVVISLEDEEIGDRSRQKKSKKRKVPTPATGNGQAVIARLRRRADMVPHLTSELPGRIAHSAVLEPGFENHHRVEEDLQYVMSYNDEVRNLRDPTRKTAAFEELIDRLRWFFNAVVLTTKQSLLPITRLKRLNQCLTTLVDLSDHGEALTLEGCLHLEKLLVAMRQLMFIRTDYAECSKDILELVSPHELESSCNGVLQPALSAVQQALSDVVAAFAKLEEIRNAMHHLQQGKSTGQDSTLVGTMEVTLRLHQELAQQLKKVALGLTLRASAEVDVVAVGISKTDNPQRIVDAIKALQRVMAADISGTYHDDVQSLIDVVNNCISKPPLAPRLRDGCYSFADSIFAYCGYCKSLDVQIELEMKATRIAALLYEKKSNSNQGAPEPTHPTSKKMKKKFSGVLDKLNAWGDTVKPTAMDGVLQTFADVWSYTARDWSIQSDPMAFECLEKLERAVKNSEPGRSKRMQKIRKWKYHLASLANKK
ncbi:hypothetical protein PHYBOEH_003779 [Phytophthora boehmeriae]|uniref:Uncharacterized protein n=1 Tax=Phytophthora boehmeriae TaxID=109152 RepID=A0A8T1WUU1_9STRA|nr:hypothetical protein PHYBOEH_003779 [Phytophthora boehmeriae]